MKPWRRLETRDVVRDRWVSLRADTCELPNGLVISPYYVLEENEWVHIFAQDDVGKVLIVRQYRYAANRVCVELPGGVVNAGETELEAAKRELLEETGYLAAEWVAASASFANPARQTNRIHLFLARGLNRHAEQALDNSEEITFSFATASEIKAMIAKSEFSQALHIASFYLALEACISSAR